MKVTNELIDAVGQKFTAIADCLTEKGRRLWSAAEALSYGHGGVLLVSKATNISRTTIHQGIKEIQNDASPDKRGVRSCGGGRKNLKTLQPDLIEHLNALVEPTSRGDPESPLRWTCKSTRKLASELNLQGYPVSHMTVATLLQELD